MRFTINVNNSEIEVKEGEKLLTALRRNGIKIPTLCYMENFTPAGACRLCVVEVEGKRDLITSCSYPVEKDMVVKTNSARVIKARKAIVEMLLSSHPDDCLYCERNGNCELQFLAEEMNIKERRYFSKKNALQRDHSSPSVYRDPAKCILCNRCVRVCEEVQLVTALEFVSRGNKTTVNSAFSKGLNVSSCINCGQCIMVCPTGALVDISHIEKVQTVLSNPSKPTAALVSPAFVASVAEHMGIKASDDPLGRIVAALRKMSFDYVYDLSFGSDMNVLLEAELLQDRIKKGNTPLFSSCCPAWIKYAEEFLPEMISHISTIKSPHQLSGMVLKNRKSEDYDNDLLYTVSFMPCVANKFEASREENTKKGKSEIDAVITIREFLRMLRSFGIDLKSLASEKPEPFMVPGSKAGMMTAYSGGKAEAIAIALHRLDSGEKGAGFKFTPPKNPISRKEVKVKIGGNEVGFAWVSGIKEAQQYLDELKNENRSDIHYIEVMACENGCVGGGGQPIHWNKDKPRSRKKTCQELEKNAVYAHADLNQDISTLITENKNNKELDLETRFHKRDFIK
ncbi:MAG: [Fe-Fe] hydrogenase large subunit C-terminal domain-containing protein [Bacteroidales bacterium]